MTEQTKTTEIISRISRISKMKINRPTPEKQFEGLQQKHDNIRDLVNRLLEHFRTIEENEKSTESKYYVSILLNERMATQQNNDYIPTLLYDKLVYSNRIVLQTSIKNNTTINTLLYLMGYVFNENCDINGNMDYYFFFSDIPSTKETVEEVLKLTDSEEGMLDIFDYSDDEDEDENKDKNLKEPLLRAYDLNAWLNVFETFKYIDDNDEDAISDNFYVFDEVPPKRYNAISYKSADFLTNDFFQIEKQIGQRIYTINDLIQLNNSYSTYNILK